MRDYNYKEPSGRRKKRRSMYFRILVLIRLDKGRNKSKQKSPDFYFELYSDFARRNKVNEYDSIGD
jgi:hypothetical protein